MKKILYATLMAFSVLTGGIGKVAAQTQEAQTMTPKILIAYYSLSGNTKEVAEAIQKEIGGDLFEIQTVQSYPAEYQAITTQVKKEINEGYKPALKAKVDNIAQYDTVFIGSPNWWGTIAPAVSSFVTENDLNGKTVIPFITHGGGGVQNTVRDLTAQCAGCSVQQDGWVGYGSHTIGIGSWLKELGFKK